MVKPVENRTNNLESNQSLDTDVSISEAWASNATMGKNVLRWISMPLQKPADLTGEHGSEHS